MPKIVKNGLEYSGTPLEEVTAWPPTGDSVQIEQPLMGNTDISEVGDGTVTGAISELNNGLANIGDVIAFDSKNVTTIPAANFVDIYGKTLPAGKYILSAKIFCNINNASCAIVCGNLRQQLSAPANVYMMVCGLIESDGTSETKIEFYQGGSSAMTRSYDHDSVYAVRIA